ncbi:helix-turn-helix domain-containing protein [Mesorhizobium australicum]|uniref:Helix-turn-helix domain-containing protein n=1 Tax=Mesorhizobium australicum TaxID=536018 RepID=A0ACC6SVN0_9HYPH
MTVHTVAPARADRKKPAKPEIPWRQRPFLPLITAAELLGVSPSSLYRMESEGKLTFNKLGGRTLVAVSSLVKLIDTAECWTPSDRGSAARAKRQERARAGWEG